MWLCLDSRAVVAGHNLAVQWNDAGWGPGLWRVFLENQLCCRHLFFVVADQKLIERWHVYLLECADGTLYTGIARDMQRRLGQHNGELSGGAKYTRGRRPVRLLWSVTENNRSSALQREAAIKKLPRRAKLRLAGTS